MIKTTKLYIVVFLALVLAHLPVFAQFNGGMGDGSHSDILSLTTCVTPPHFYAFFGGTGDGGETNLDMNTTCATPPHFYAFMGGTDDGAGVERLTLTACATPPSQFFAYMGGTNDGAGVDLLNPLTCGTPSQFYAYMGGAANGFALDSEIVCPTVPPVANFSASPTTICRGSSVTFTDLSTNVPSSWSWTFPGGTPASSTVQNPTVIYNTAGVYNVTLTATNSHGTNAITMNGYITVNAIPVASAGTNVAICIGSSTTLNANGGTTYSWLPATGLSSTTIANPDATPTVTTSYTVTATSNGCSSTSSVSVTVNPLPTVSAAPITICNGSSGTLTASGAATYAWSPGLSAATGTSVTANPTVTSTYTVTGTSAAGCVNSNTVTVTVNPSPTANAGSDVTICNGSSTTLSASGGGSYSWSPSTGLSSTTIANPVASPTVTRTYTVTVTNGSGCTSTDAMTVTVTPLPSASAGSNVSICNGSSTTLNASGGTSYSWLPATGLSSTTIANPVANPTATTTYTVNVTNNGCSATSAVTVTVNSIPTANAGSNVSICNGSSTVLTATGGGTYNWTPAFSGLSSTVIANPTASPTATTTYTVSVSNGTCSSTSSVTVTVNPLPTANAGSDVTICNGTSTTLSASGGSSYIWNPATGLSSNSVANPVASPTVTTSYTVTVTNSNGCTATDAVVVNVNSVTANAGSDVTICTGTSTTLNASGGTVYNWTPATGLSSTSIANPVANPTATTTYTVTVTNNGCTATDVVTVTVNTSLTADAGTDVSICFGSSTTLNGSGGSTYSWSPASGLNSTIIANPVATPATTTTYTVTASSGGCSSTSSVTVTVDPLPTASITADGPTTFCQGDSVILTSSAGNSYLWSGGQTSSAITVLSSGNHSVTVTSVDGCSATSTVIGVIVHAITPSSITAGGATTFCQGDSVTLTASTGSSYLWSTGAITQSITVSTSNNYNVSVADVNGCSTSAASVFVTVNPNPATPVISPAGIYNICVGDTVILVTDTANSYVWSNGSTNASLAVSTAAIFGVTVYNSFGCATSSAATTEVTVNDPVSDFTATPLLVFIPSANVSYTAATNGSGPFTYLWDFGDASTSAASAPSHTYSNIGFKTITLTVSDSTGCSKTLSKSDYVQVEQLFPSTALTTGTTIDISGVSFVDGAVGIFTLTDGNCIVTLDTGNTWSPMPTGNTNALTGASKLDTIQHRNIGEV
ncbi:MAG: hypothetical protein K0S44_2319 [Bacteroidetes bacterium]|nr:hypothetical protein [Bacteroidota bacterium]